MVIYVRFTPESGHWVTPDLKVVDGVKRPREVANLRGDLPTSEPKVTG